MSMAPDIFPHPGESDELFSHRLFEELVVEGSWDHRSRIYHAKYRVLNNALNDENEDPARIIDLAGQRHKAIANAMAADALSLLATRTLAERKQLDALLNEPGQE